MKMNSCAEVRANFSSYVDGAISGQEMLDISRHIDGAEGNAGVRVGGCVECGGELDAWRKMQDALATVGSAKAPADLALKLRIAISHERARRDSRWRDKLSLAWDNVVRPRLLQVSAGLAGSVALLSVIALFGLVAVPQPVLANDEPLGALTQPHLLYSNSFPGESVMTPDAPVVIQAQVDARGRVYDFAILSGPRDNAMRTHIEAQLLGSVFEPASAFGVPVRGQVLMTLSGISVHG
jgi:hypothetical protein